MICLRTGSAWMILAGAVALASQAVAERQPYDRYKSIVDRQMFGPLPVGFDPTKSPSEVSKGAGSAAEKELTKEQEKVKSSIRFSVINVTPNGETAVGFTDNADPKMPVHYYMKVGETRGGWEVKEADAKAATMTVVKDGIEVSLSLGGDSSKATGTAAAAGGGDATSANGSHRSSLLNTLSGRRRARREREEAEERAANERAERRAAEEKARDEERARREEEEKAQRAAEREESRRQLMQIQEELRKAREERAAREKESNSGEESMESE